MKLHKFIVILILLKFVQPKQAYYKKCKILKNNYKNKS